MGWKALFASGKVKTIQRENLGRVQTKERYDCIGQKRTIQAYEP
jgi:hypothetical protein